MAIQRCRTFFHDHIEPKEIVGTAQGPGVHCLVAASFDKLP